MTRKWCWHLAVCLAWIFISSAGASPQWLLTQQQPDGSIATSADLATSVQSTAEAVKTLRVLGLAENLGGPVSFLASQPYPGTEYLSRKVIASAQAALPTDSLIADLIAHQNPDGGFGESAGYQGTAFDTAFALEALAAANAGTHPGAALAVGYLLQRQHGDGGWSDHGSSSDIHTTALVARALNLYRDRFAAVPVAVANANNFLLSRRTADGLWPEDLISAQSLLTLATAVTDVAPLQQSVDAFRARRFVNTSWSNDVHTTALALRALHVFDARRGGGSVAKTAGSVTGYVLLAGTPMPIEGATVAIGTQAQARSNAEGFFVLSGVAGGERTLTVSRPGYLPASHVVMVRDGQLNQAGTIFLAQSAQQALVRGRVFDAHDGRALAGVAVSFSGASASTTQASTTSDSRGEFEISALEAGAYSVRFELAGYHPVTGSLEAPAGSATSVVQALTRQEAYLDEAPANLSGRVIDGTSLTPLVDATVVLDGSAITRSDSDGRFELLQVARGSHQLDVSRSGYHGAHVTFILPPGAAAPLGDVSLFAMTPDAAATTLTLSGTVVDGLDNVALPGASVTLLQSGETVLTDDRGQFTFGEIASLSFDLAIAAADHEPRTFGVSASGFGSVAGTFVLPRAAGDPEAATSILRGVVRDSVTGGPLADANLRIANTSFATVSAADGSFELIGISARDFVLVADLAGYSERRYEIQLARHGTYAIEVVLTREPGGVIDTFDISSVIPLQTATGAHTRQLFAARIRNLTDQEHSALIIADVLDATGQRVASMAPYAAGTEVPTSDFTFIGGQTLELTVPWDTAQHPPGTYRLQVRVTEPGTLSREVPGGVVLAQAETSASVIATSAITGGLALDPPLAQAGSSLPVQLSALLVNDGNVPLTGQAFTLSIHDPDTGAILHGAQAEVPMIEVGDNATVQFGAWMPSRAGDLPVQVTSDHAAVTGRVSGVLYVGDKATGTFTVDRSIVPLGTRTVRASVALRGVDVRTASSTNELFAEVRDAIRDGGVFVAREAPLWNERERCLGCHIQTQSLMGLAASVGKAEIDQDALQYLYNDIVGSQQANGAFNASHQSIPVVSNALALWSMSAWPDARQAFRAMYLSASFQLSRLSNSGDQSWWASDHNDAWWSTSEGPTMAATKGMAATLRMAQEVGGTNVPDYSLEPSHELGVPNLMDFEQSPDGKLRYIQYASTLHERDLATGQSRAVASGITNAYGIAVRDDGAVYVTSGSRILQVNPDGTRSTLVDVAGSSNLLDVLIGPDGFLYVADFRNHRILRVSQAGVVSVFASGGLLSQPVGLALDEAGNLYVANYGRFNILKITATGAVSAFARGLPYRPVWLRRGPDGAFYAVSANFNHSGYTPSGLWRIDAGGFVEHIPTFDSPNLFGYNGMNFIGDSLYVGHEAGRRLYRLQTQPLVPSQLTAMRTALSPVARFVLARHADNNQRNDIHAMRLITLAEARPYVDDTGLLAQIDTGIQNIAALLRQRQRADGGWTYTTARTVSDPYTTAFVGLALEYTNPSVNDPMVVNSITFLLNTQGADFSWSNQNAVFGTRLGPTSFVMAYLPIALDRLGGIDVDLTLVTPPDVHLSNPSQAPVEQSNVPAGVLYRWSLQGVTSNARTISFDTVLDNLGYQEERSIASEAYLTFKNSFTQESLRSDLAIPTVRAVSDLALSLHTDRNGYSAHSDVSIDSQISNVGPPVASGTLRLSIRAADGATVSELESLAIGAVSAGASVHVPAIWNTGTVLAGAYQVYGRLHNEAGVLVSEAAASFEVRHEGAQTAAGVTSDRPVYAAWDSVVLEGRIRNLSQNVIQREGIAELRVLAPSGQSIFTRSFALGELTPLSLRDVTATVNLVDAVNGVYPVELAVRDALSRNLLATAQTQFTVERDDLQALTGRTTVQSTRVERGTANVCTDTANNISTAALAGVELTRKVVYLENGQTVQSEVQTLDFAARQDNVLTRSIATGALPEGGYACILTATYQGRTRQLGAVGFDVVTPPIRIVSSLAAGTRGRLLVLVDGPTSTGDASDPFSPPELPDLNTQRAHVQSVLEAAGWSYTIVESAESFEREFDTGGYEVYAVLSEAVKLPVALQDRLVAAVQAGAGLVVAGNHDRRNSKLEDALGIQSLGRYLDVAQLAVEFSEVMDAAEEAVTIDPHPLEMRLEGATAFAHYGVLQPKGSQQTAAATSYAYGEGRSVYVSIDLPLLGAGAGDDSLFAKLFVSAVRYVHPETITPRTGRVLPLNIVLMNEGVPATGRVLLMPPAGVTIVDRGTAATQADGSLAWEYALDAAETIELPLWVRLPAQPGDIEFHAVIQTGVAPDYVEHGDATLTVRVVPGS